jgi:F420-dependent oxidoreductase-like protein
MRIGVTIGEPATGPDLGGLIEEVRDREKRGFASVFMPNIFGLDAIGALAIAGRATERIELATAVVPTFPRHPFALAQQALTAQVACGGRFVLGIGLSHRVVIEDMLGLSYAEPVRHMREYLRVLRPLLEGQPAAHRGELYRVNAGLRFPGVPRVPLLVAALGPAMLRIAGELADGTITWMTGPKTLEAHIRPTITEAAKRAGRPEPRIVASLPIAVTRQPERAREVAGRAFQIYGALPSYRAMLDREGVAGPADVAVVGEEGVVRRALRRLEEIGVTDLSAAVFPADEGAVQRTLGLLADEL